MYSYGLIGDMASAALVGTDGAIDWCCFPRFDSPSVFAAILDQEDGGRFRISPTDSGFTSAQEYLPDTNILETTFTTAAGIVTITDFMPISDHDDDPATPFEASHEIHRIVTCISGSVEMRCDFNPIHDYARTVPEFRKLREGAVQARGGRQTMTLVASIPLPFDDRGVGCNFTSERGRLPHSCLCTATAARPALNGFALL